MKKVRSQLKLLDLFCCEGGAGMGYEFAGFDVTGVDISPQPKYPLKFILGDAMDFISKHGKEYDAIHTSPPCQGYSLALRHLSKPKPKLIEKLKSILEKTGKPWIIENVIGSPLSNDTDLFGNHGVELCGTMFGLRIYRHRIFETNFKLPLAPQCNHSKHALNPHSSQGRKRIYNEFGKQNPEKLWQKEMGVEWISRHGARQSIPPVFTEWIGQSLKNFILK